MVEDREHLSQDEAAEPPRVVQRRRRPPLSCVECRRRKLKCDRSLPCGQCVRSKTAESCAFVGPHPGAATESSRQMSPPVSRMRMPGGSDSQSAANGGMFVFDSKMGSKSSSNRVAKRSQSDELHELRHRLRMLENALARPNALQTPETSVCDVVSEIGTSHNSTEAAGVDDRVRYLPDSSFRGKKGKTRYFGRSHYTTTVSFVSASELLSRYIY
jgi:Fungal Zn(2)-Cys(6) binuclear cluster domain